MFCSSDCSRFVYPKGLLRLPNCGITVYPIGRLRWDAIMNVHKILERNRFTALCGGCGEIFHYSTIEEVISAHQDGPNCETPCPSCTTGILCACEYCQSLITDELKNAAASVPVVPTPSESSRPEIENADNAVYRHQESSVFEKNISGFSFSLLIRSLTVIDGLSAADYDFIDSAIYRWEVENSITLQNMTVRQLTALLSKSYLDLKEQSK